MRHEKEMCEFVFSSFSFQYVRKRDYSKYIFLFIKIDFNRFLGYVFMTHNNILNRGVAQMKLFWE